MAKRTIPQDTRTSGEYGPKDWKKLRQKIMNDSSNVENWREAFDLFFRYRIESRFLKPVRVISQSIASLKAGEGFTITAILCILIEYLQAYYEGLVYTTGESSLYEYHSSKDLFRRFLTSHEPFKDKFSQEDAKRFYDDVRCGVLHEGATKGNAKIRAEKGGLLIEKTGDGFIIYRNALLAALESHIENYRAELLKSETLKTNFFRKVDELNGISRELYFAYGSNLLKDQFEVERRMFVYTWRVAKLDDYQITFNKKSRSDPSVSFANLAKQKGQTTWGVLYEMDGEDLDRLTHEYEKGYDRRDVKVTVSKKMCQAVTFISRSTCDAPPSRSYVEKILAGAIEKGLLSDYIEKVRSIANL